MTRLVKFTKDGKVIIPLFLWNEIKELAEYLYLEELVRERANSPAIISLDDLIKEEGVSREDLES